MLAHALILLFLQIQSALFPPPKPPQFITVSTSTSTGSVRPGATISLFVDVVPKPGLHVYAPGAKDYTPIALTLIRQPIVTAGKLLYPKSEILALENERVPVFKVPF